MTTPCRAAVVVAAALGALAAGGCASTGAAPEAAYLDGFAAAAATATRFTPATESIPGLDMDRAYALQRRLVARRLAAGDRIAGFKGGLMSQKSLADRGVDAPLTGVLFASGDSRGEIPTCAYRSGIFELKLGFVFRRPVTKPVSSVAELRTLVSAVQPVVELPDIAYRDPARYGALDMVAANITAARYVRGVAAAPGDVDLDALKVSLTRDGVRVAQGDGKESLGGQWASLLTLVNLLIERGGAIAPGQFVLTGKIGDKGDIPPGVYSADYGPLGTVTFAVKLCAAP